MSLLHCDKPTPTQRMEMGTKNDEREWHTTGLAARKVTERDTILVKVYLSITADYKVEASGDGMQWSGGSVFGSLCVPGLLFACMGAINNTIREINTDTRTTSSSGSHSAKHFRKSQQHLVSSSPQHWSRPFSSGRSSCPSHAIKVSLVKTARRPAATPSPVERPLLLRLLGSRPPLRRQRKLRTIPRTIAILAPPAVRFPGRPYRCRWRRATRSRPYPGNSVPPCPGLPRLLASTVMLMLCPFCKATAAVAVIAPVSIPRPAPRQGPLTAAATSSAVRTGTTSSPSLAAVASGMWWRASFSSFSLL